MKKNILGHTGIQITELSMGTLTFSRHQTALSPPEGGRVIRKAFELGINFFDTAISYGTHHHLREGLKGVVGQVVISTKSHAKTWEMMEKDFETSLQELGRDYIDLFQLHLVESSADLEARRGAIDFLIDKKKQGQIRAIGVSVHKVEGAKAVVANPNIDVLFPILNIKGLGIMDGSIEDMIEICRLADRRDMGIMAMKPLGGGLLRTSPKEAFSFLRNLGVVDSVSVGMKSPEEVEMNVTIFEDRPVSEEIRRRVETLPRRLRINRFCKGCGECVKACAQKALSVDLSQADPLEGKKGQAVVDNDKCILCGYCAEACPEFSIRVI